MQIIVSISKFTSILRVLQCVFLWKYYVHIWIFT